MMRLRTKDLNEFDKTWQYNVHVHVLPSLYMTLYFEDLRMPSPTQPSLSQCGREHSWPDVHKHCPGGFQIPNAQSPKF